MNGSNIIERIQQILERHDTVPQVLKDELILLGLAEVLKTVQDHSNRLQFLEKYKPYLQGLAWARQLSRPHRQNQHHYQSQETTQCQHPFNSSKPVKMA